MSIHYFTNTYIISHFVSGGGIERAGGAPKRAGNEARGAPKRAGHRSARGTEARAELEAGAPQKLTKPQRDTLLRVP
jgi:hypothetical protein